MKIVGIGQCSLDYLALVESFPGNDTKKEVLSWDEQGGGPVATALVALARLGADCSFHGIAGDDPESGKIRQSLIDAGVDVGGLVMRSNACSQKAFIVIEKGTGKRTIFWKRPTGEALRSFEIGEAFLQGADFLLLDGLMTEASIFAARLAKGQGIPVMLDAGRLREGMMEVALISDYVVASEAFAREIGYDGDAGKFSSVIQKLGIATMTVTLGENGSITFLKDEFFSLPAYEVAPVDTTGAGDVFHGGYVFGIIKGWDIDTTVRFASAMAALKCLHVGGRAGIPEFNSVALFLKDRGFDLPAGRP